MTTTTETQNPKAKITITFTPLHKASKNFTSDFFLNEDGQSVFWVGTKGNMNTDTVQTYEVFELNRDDNGREYINTKDGSVYYTELDQILDTDKDSIESELAPKPLQEVPAIELKEVRVTQTWGERVETGQDYNDRAQRWYTNWYKQNYAYVTIKVIIDGKEHKGELKQELDMSGNAFIKRAHNTNSVTRKELAMEYICKIVKEQRAAKSYGYYCMETPLRDGIYAQL